MAPSGSRTPIEEWAEQSTIQSWLQTKMFKVIQDDKSLKCLTGYLCHQYTGEATPAFATYRLKESAYWNAGNTQANQNALSQAKQNALSQAKQAAAHVLHALGRQIPETQEAFMRYAATRTASHRPDFAQVPDNKRKREQDPDWPKVL